MKVYVVAEVLVGVVLYLALISLFNPSAWRDFFTLLMSFSEKDCQNFMQRFLGGKAGS